MKNKKAIEQVITQISAYIEMSSLAGVFGHVALQGNSKKKVEARRLLQIFYLGVIDGMCQFAGLSEIEQNPIEQAVLEENNTLKDLKISDKEFPLKDWYAFSAKGIIDKIEGRVLYYGGLTARIHAAIINDYLDYDEHGNSNAMNAMGIPILYNKVTKKEFRVTLDEWIEKALELNKQISVNQHVKNEHGLDHDDDEHGLDLEVIEELSRMNRKKRDNPGCLVPIIISLSSFGLLIISLLIG